MNNSLLNITQVPEEDDNSYTERICMLIIGCVSCVFDLTSLATVLASRPRLIKTEFFILIWICFLTLNFKFATIMYFHNSFNFALLYAIISYTYEMINNFCINITLFYYALFHLSTLRRSQCFLRVFNLIHNPKSFVVYSSLFLVVSLVISLAFSITTYFELRPFEQNPLLYSLFFVKYSIPIICETVVPSLFAIVTYLVATVIVCASRLRNHQSKYSTNNDEKRKFRRNLVLLLKFWFLATYNFVCFFPSVILHLIQVLSNLHFRRNSVRSLFWLFLLYIREHFTSFSSWYFTSYVNWLFEEIFWIFMLDTIKLNTLQKIYFLI